MNRLSHGLEMKSGSLLPWLLLILYDFSISSLIRLQSSALVLASSGILMLVVDVDLDDWRVESSFELRGVLLVTGLSKVKRVFRENDMGGC